MSKDNDTLIITFHPAFYWPDMSDEQRMLATIGYTEGVTRALLRRLSGVDVEWIVENGDAPDTYDVEGSPPLIVCRTIRDYVDGVLAEPCERLKIVPCTNCGLTVEPMDPDHALPCGCKICVTCLDRGRAGPDQHEAVCVRNRT